MEAILQKKSLFGLSQLGSPNQTEPWPEPKKRKKNKKIKSVLIFQDYGLWFFIEIHTKIVKLFNLEKVCNSPKTYIPWN